MNRLHHSTEFIEKADKNDAVSLADVLTRVARQATTVQHKTVDASLAAVITVEEDTRYVEQTLISIVNQTVLPGSLLVVNCAPSSYKAAQHDGAIAHKALQMFPMSASLVTAQGKSYGEVVTHAVNQALDSGMLTSAVEYMWLLHDDSRPLDDSYVDTMNEVRRNNALATVIGAKQLSWDGEVLSNVGYFADSRHGVTSLVVDGEIDQDQYDNRQDVYAVSLAGAFVRVSDWMRVGGFNAQVGTFGQSRDFCRRVVRSGGRVIVEPRARLAHRRARLEGVRSAQGTTRATNPDDLRSYKNTAFTQMIARDTYRYSDVAMVRWLYMWPISLVLAVVRGIANFMKKKPYEALCELVMPWYNLTHMGAIASVRSALSGVQELSLAKLQALVASSDSLRSYKDHLRDIFSERGHKIVSPLVRAHVRALTRVRYTWLAVFTVIVFFANLAIHFGALRAVLQGVHLVSPLLLSTASSTQELFNVATTPYTFAGITGTELPPSPFLVIYALISLLTFGHASATSTVIVLFAAPAALMSMWALVGIFTRSNVARIALAVTWVVSGYMTGIFFTGHLPMMLVYVFLPAAVAFAAKALGVYQTEYPIESEPSIQASAWAALCFAVVCACEPQLFLAMLVVGIAVSIIYHRHVIMLVSVGVPSLVILAPTLIAVIRQPHSFGQLFADVTSGVSVGSGVTGANGASGALSSGVSSGARAGQSAYQALLQLFIPSADASTHTSLVQSLGSSWASTVSLIVTVCLALALLCSVITLCIPQCVKPSRSMWIGILTGIVLAVASSGIAVGLNAQGLVYASMLPAGSLVLMCILSGLAMMSGPAVTQFVPILQKDKRLLDEQDAVIVDPGKRGEKTAVARTAFGITRSCVIALCVVLTLAWSVSSSIYATSLSSQSLTSSSASLPIVAQEYLKGNSARRVLVVSPQSNRTVDYSVLTSAHGDIISSSAAVDASSVFPASWDKQQAHVEEAIAQLQENSHDDAIAALSDAGFGGIYVVYNGADSAFSSFVSHASASNNTETVVNTNQGAYIRISIRASQEQGVNMKGFDAASTSVMRYVWLAAMVLVGLVYLILGLPRLGAREGE